MSQRWFYPRGALARDGWESVVDGSLAGWEHTGLRVAELAGGEVLGIGAPGEERIVVPLSGSFEVTHAVGDASPRTVGLAGRAGPFSGPTDVLYLDTAEEAEISGEGRVAVASAPTDRRIPTRHLAAGDVPIELRGGGAASREVRDLGVPGVLDAARLIVCEVLTPSGNWSSYPPHKHDEDMPGHESRLEEIYYFEAEAAEGSPAAPDAAFGTFGAYSSPAGELELDATVRTGDIALVPYGYHGPAAAAPGYDLYYLNVMAGPDPERVWLISDDPAHAWVRDGWAEQGPDPRLPFGKDRP